MYSPNYNWLNVMQHFLHPIAVVMLACFMAFSAFPGPAAACPACWAGYGSGDERLNKPLADLRKIYEAKGKAALPYIRNTIKTSSDPLVINRAGGYLVALDDKASLPLLEDMVRSVAKRVSFGSFGLRSYEYRARMAAAHAVSSLGSGASTADFIWQRFARISMERKEEVPYLLSALDDPELESRMFFILDQQEGHQLMINALEALKYSGGRKVIAPLQKLIEHWAVGGQKTNDVNSKAKSSIHYSILAIKGLQVCAALEDKKP